ncbi:MAG: mucoidy inhibitor MuiA family protein [Verrucomicrobiales bacterium]
MSRPFLRAASFSLVLIGGLLAQADRATPPPAPSAAPTPPPASPPSPPAPVPPRPDLTSQVAAVTLYRDTARVTRGVQVPAGRAGAGEFIISPLPAATMPESVHADREAGITVRSVTCRPRDPLNPDHLNAEVARLDRAIRETERTMAMARNEIALRRIRQEYLRSLGEFVAPAAAQEMTHGVLQADELAKVTAMHFREYETASQEILDNDFDLQDAAEKLNALRGEREKLAAGPPVTFEAVVHLDAGEGGGGSFQLHYLVRDCGWMPSYNVRGDTRRNEAEIEFNALIHQVSGEDWADTALILSTASPAAAATNPRLEPLYVALAPQGETGALASAYGNHPARPIAGLTDRPGVSSAGDQALQSAANDSAAGVQLIELSNRLSDLRRLDQVGLGRDLAIDYALAQRATVVSRRQSQIVPVLRHSTAAAFQHVAAPVLTAAVFREAIVANTSDHDLLGGPVSIYLDGAFTGRHMLPTIARGRSVTLGFGVDGQLRARRTLADRNEDVQGGNRRVTVTTEVVIDSSKDQPVIVHVRERLPHYEDTASLRVTLGTLSHPLSEDSDYVRFERPTGLLLWSLPVNPGTGAQATSLRYAYALEFDKNLVLSDVSADQKVRLREAFQHQRAYRETSPD